MVELSFSKGLLEKFGDTVFPKLAQQKRTQRYFRKLKSKDRVATNINAWIGSMKDSDLVQQIVAEQNFKSILNDDSKMLKILKWVRKNIKYVSDYKVHAQSEYWQTVDETIMLRTGDCEDGAILILLLAFHSDIRMDLVHLTWGKVIGGGHAYITYTSIYDGVERVLDWCYWFTGAIIKLRKWFSKEEKYMEIWGRTWI